MPTERTEQRPDGTVERTVTTDRPVVVERGGSGVGGIMALVVGVLLVAVIGYFLMNMNRNDAIKTDAVAGAAESVGNAADKVGEAAGSATAQPER